MGNTFGHITVTDEIQEFIDDVNENTNVQLVPEVRDGLLVGWDVSTDDATRIYLNLTDPRKAFDRFVAESGATVERHASEELLEAVLETAAAE